MPLAWLLANFQQGDWPMFQAIIRLFCDLQSARHPLFRQLAQVINPLKFHKNPANNKEIP